MMKLFENFKSLNKYKEQVFPLTSLSPIKLELLYCKNHAERERDGERQRQRRQKKGTFSHSISVITILFSILNLGFLL